MSTPDFPPGRIAREGTTAWLKLALYPRKSLARDAGLPPGTPGAPAFSLGHNVSSEAEVDQVMEQVRQAGAVFAKRPRRRFWDGYAGYFRDPDGHLWEIAWNPQWPLPD